MDVEGGVGVERTVKSGVEVGGGGVGLGGEGRKGVVEKEGMKWRE